MLLLGSCEYPFVKVLPGFFSSCSGQGAREEGERLDPCLAQEVQIEAQ